MATEKQMIANQQNAKHSTGPRTETGKRRSRRNALRDGLTAETVIDTLEDAVDYKAFERAIKFDYSPQTAIEGQLVSRLASLLWRLRRAAIVESGLPALLCSCSDQDRERHHLLDHEELAHDIWIRRFPPLLDGVKQTRAQLNQCVHASRRLKEKLSA
jgi:hypothetical protein